MFNLISALLVVVFTIFGFFGKYKQDTKSGEKINRIDETTSQTSKDLSEELKKKKKSSINKYQELESKFKFLTIGMQKMYFVEYKKEEIAYLREQIINSADRILQDTLVTENDKLFEKWKLMENLVLNYLTIYSMRDGLEYNENGKRNLISPEFKKQKLSELQFTLIHLENEINLEVYKD